jgi:hypothetical protein
MRRSLRKQLKQALRRAEDIECDGLTPEALDRTCFRMEQYDGLPPQGRALVQEYGMRIGLEASRLFYGRWEQAAAWAEQQRRQRLPIL